jgi:DNA-directed RNA polymerase subunit RPC12/RpoP
MDGMAQGSDRDGRALARGLEQLPTDELVSILRNRDEEEWRPEVFDIVALILTARGVSPAEIQALGPEGSEVAESAPTVTIARFFNVGEAHASRMALEEAGIRAWVADEAGGTMYGVGVGTRLQVRATDEAAAREVLASPPAPGDALPADLADPACPACGSRKVAPEAWVAEDDAGVPRSGSRRKWYYVCADCDEAWPLEEMAEPER